MPPLPSALADIPNGSVTSPRGFTAAAAHAGLKADGAPDVALLVGATSCATAGVFTKNALRAAPVVYDADLLAERPGRMRAVAMNARVANACTGAPGLAAARAMAQAAEQRSEERRVGKECRSRWSTYDQKTKEYHRNEKALLIRNCLSLGVYVALVYRRPPVNM